MRLRKVTRLSNRAIGSAAIGAALALIPAMALTAGPARADFGTPVTLSRAGQDATAPQVAVDANGDALVVWVRADGSDIQIQASARSAAGLLGPIQTLSRSGQFALEPQVGIDAGGNALVVWIRSDGTNDRIQARARSAAGVLGPIETLSRPGENAASPQVAVSADGRALIVWTRSDGNRFRIQARARSAGGVLGPVQTLSDRRGDGAFEPQVAIDAAGRALVVWRRGNLSDFLIQARARSAAGVLGPIETLSRRGQAVLDPQVALNAGGNALVAWRRLDAGNRQIQARARSAAGVLGPLQNLSEAGQTAEFGRVAIDADGDALVVWQRSVGMAGQIKARGRSAAGVLGPEQTLSPAGQNAIQPEVAIDANGKAQIVWERKGEFSDRIQARSRSATGVLGPVQDLSRPGLGVAAPQVAIGGNGDALAVWSRFDRDVVSRVQAAAGP